MKRKNPLIKSKSRIALIFFLVFLFYGYIHHNQNGDIITWRSGVRLKSKDFRAKPKDTIDPDVKMRIIAISYIDIESDFDYDKLGKRIIVVKATFDPKKSWTLGWKGTLAHEQIHFDIAELYARRLRKAYGRQLFFKTGYGAKASRTYQRYWNAYKKYQHKFDSLTVNIKDEKFQEMWENSLMYELEKLKKYESPIVKLTVL